MIFAIKPFEIHDGDGIRTTVFFKGCPLRCKWCHNPESFSFKKEISFTKELCVNCLKCVGICTANTAQEGEHIFKRENCVACGRCEAVCPNNAFEIFGQEMTAQEIAKQILKDELFLKGSGGGATFSGGEPLMQADLCVAVAKILKEKDIHIAVDTSGFVNREEIDKMIPYTDAFLFDIKAIDEAVHIACTGVSNRLILENIKYIDSLDIPIEVRYPYVPTMNDDQAEKIAEFVKELKNVRVLRVLPYHNYAEAKYACLGLPFTDFPVPTKEEIGSVLERMKHCGLQNVSSFQE